MPRLDLNQNLLSAGADFSASDWAGGSASASLDFRGAVELDRGVNLEIGVGVLAQLDLAFHKFLAADAQARVEASAGLKGQIQLPMDVFGEAGVAVRLEAIAQAAAMVRLGIGLNVGDFIALAEQDPRIDGIALELLKILLEEIKVEAGVSGKAAFSAMAYANLAITARFIDDDVRGIKAGFTVGGGYGVGLEGGYGYAMFAELGLLEPRRFIRRTIDALVDEVYRSIEPDLPDDFAKEAASYMRYPVKMALRSSFELGMALAEASPTFSGDGREIAKQCVHVILEEAQRALLEELARMAIRLFRRALEEIGIDEQAWSAAKPQRDAFSSKLEGLPANPFELNAANAAYWSELVAAAINVGLALGDDSVNRPKWQEPIAIAWAAAHLAMISLERMSSASARVSALGLVSATARAEAFVGPMPSGTEPSAVVREFVNASLGRNSTHVLSQDDLVEFLVRDVVLETLVSEVPEVRPVLEIIAGPTNDSLVAAARVVFKNIGAFAPDPATGQVDAQATLAVLSHGLQTYLDVRIKQELAPLLYEATANNPMARLYIDEVMLPSMDFAIGTAFRTVLDWSFGGIGYRDALREACSSIVIKLFGRSLVVTTDVLSTYTLEHMSTEVRRFSNHIDDDGGLADVLSGMTSLDRRLVAEVLTETLDICADVLTPLPPEKRANIRDLLYDLIDTAPSDLDASWLDQLQQDTAFPSAENQQKMLELSEELGGQALEYFSRFFSRVLLKLTEAVAEQIATVIAQIVDQVEEWNTALREFVEQIAGLVARLPAQIDALADEANRLLAEALSMLANLLDGAHSSNATAFNRSACQGLVATAQGRLAAVPGYAALTASQRADVRAHVRQVVEIGLRPTTDAMFGLVRFSSGSLQPLLEEIVTMLDELRVVDPGADAGSEVLAIVRRRIEQNLQAFAASHELGFDVAIQIDWQVPVPAVWGVTEWDYLPTWPWKSPKTWGWIEQDPISVHFGAALGRVELPLDDIVRAARDLLAGIAGVQALADALAERLAQFFAVEDEAKTLENGLIGARATAAELQTAAEDAGARDFAIAFNAPLPASAHDADVFVDLSLAGVPRSYLGSGAHETQRIFIWVNDEQIEPSSLDVSHSRPDLEIDADVFAMPARAADGPAQNRASRARQGLSTYAGLPAATAASALGSARPAMGSSRALRRVRADSATRSLTSAVADLAAATYDPTKVRESLAPSRVTGALPHTLRLQGRIPLSKCVSGINTLSVAVLNGAAEQVHETTSFIVTSEPVTETIDRDPSPGRKPVKLPKPGYVEPPIGILGATLLGANAAGVRLHEAAATRPTRTRTGAPRPKPSPTATSKRLAQLSAGATREIQSLTTTDRECLTNATASVKQWVERIEQRPQRNEALDCDLPEATKYGSKNGASRS